MKKLNLAGLIPSVAEKISSLAEDVLAQHEPNVHSFHIVGSAVIPDYNQKLSDINSVVVLHDMDLKFIEFLAPLGRKHGRKRIAAPLVMTPDYIRDSIDSFPIEFHDFKRIHKTIYGEDLLEKIELRKNYLRLQCEREIKTRQIGLRQAYISSLGKKENLKMLLIKSFTGSMALLRAIIFLLGKEPPIMRAEVISLFQTAGAIDTEIFSELLALKSGLIKPSEQELRRVFERYYNALEAIRKIIDELPS